MRGKYPELQNAVAMLAGVCDGAFMDDGMGFNAYDSSFGRSLAQQSTWTIKQAQAAYRMVAKYAGQLREAGIEYDDIPTPEEPQPQPQRWMREIGLDGTVWRVRWQPFSYPVLELFKSVVPDRAFNASNPQDKHWVVPRRPHNAKALLILIAKHGFTATDEETRRDIEAMSLMPNRYVGLDAERDQLVLVTDQDPNLMYDVNVVPWVKWDGPHSRWVCDVRSATDVRGFSAFLAKHDVVVMPDVAEYLDRVKRRSERLYELSGALECDGRQPGELNGGELYDFQLVPTQYLHEAGHGRVLIADDMGAGKTIEAMALAAEVDARNVLVISPPGLVLNWMREWGKWLPGWSQARLTGLKPTGRTMARVTFVGDSVVRGWEKSLVMDDWDLVIIDEAHRMKNPKTARTKAVRKITKQARRLALLTGTPVMNRANEIWSLIQIAGLEDFFGGWHEFHMRYCDANLTQWGWDTKGASEATMQGALNSILRETMMVRRRKAEILPFLPDKLPPQRIAFEIDNRREYEKAEADLAAWVMENASVDEKFKASIAHLDPVAKAEAIQAHKRGKAATARAFEALVKIGVLQRVAARGKIAPVKEWIADFLGGTDDKMIVFARHKAIQAELREAFPDAAHGLGDDDAQTRQQNIDRFQNDSHCRLFIASIDAMGVGWTGTAANHVAFVEFPWRPGDIDQATDRAHRIGQERDVNVYYLEADDTIDQDMLELIEQKRAVVEAVVDGVVAEEESDAHAALRIAENLASRIR